MSYTITFASESILVKDMKKWPKNIRDQIQYEINTKLGEKPEIFGKPLQGSLKGYRRLRIGNSYRVIFQIIGTTVKVFFIEKKPDVYKHFLKHLS